MPLFTHPSADKKDAERYRWLRDSDSETSAYIVSNMNNGLGGGNLDSGIDAAMQAEKGGEG